VPADGQRDWAISETQIVGSLQTPAT
jgi:hypothetical protein